MKEIARRLNRKLKSQQGASITFALLLFLVCAAVGSVVLTAGTSAAGRLSELPEADQRYCSVISAADMIKGLVENREVSIVKTITTTETHTCKNGEEEDVSDTEIVSKIYQEGEEKEPETDDTWIDQKLEFDSFITEAAAKLAGLENEGEGNTGPNLAAGGTITDRSFLISPSETEPLMEQDLAEAKPSLSVEVSETLGTDGTLYFDISKDGYKIQLVFKTDIITSNESSSEEGEKEITDPDYDPNLDQDDNNEDEHVDYKQTTTTVETEKTTFNWNLEEINTVLNENEEGGG